MGGSVKECIGQRPHAEGVRTPAGFICFGSAHLNSSLPCPVLVDLDEHGNEELVEDILSMSRTPCSRNMFEMYMKSSRVKLGKTVSPETGHTLKAVENRAPHPNRFWVMCQGAIWDIVGHGTPDRRLHQGPEHSCYFIDLPRQSNIRLLNLQESRYQACFLLSIKFCSLVKRHKCNLWDLVWEFAELVLPDSQ